jgi:transporter family-2 protein
VNNFYLLLAFVTGAGIGSAPWWVWTGGAFGATFIVVTIALTAEIGATLTLASIILGQLTGALIVDHYGLFGGTVIRVTPLRLTGVALLLLLLGATLIRWKAS